MTPGRDLELYQEERGAGEPLLLIPGTGFGAGAWGRFGELLAERYRVISYDRRGFGRSPAAPAESMRTHADDAAALLAQLGAAPGTVLGWSAGGLVALALAVEHPTAVRSLVLVEPSVHGLRNLTFPALAMSLRARLVRLLRRDPRAATDIVYRWTFAYRSGGSAWDTLSPRERESVLVDAEAIAAEEALEVDLRYPSRAALAALDRPVTLVLGGESQGYFHRIARYLRRLLPNCEVVTVEGASHAVHLDRPEELAAAIGG